MFEEFNNEFKEKLKETNPIDVLKGQEWPSYCGEDTRCDEIGEYGCQYLGKNGDCRLAGGRNV